MSDPTRGGRAADNHRARRDERRARADATAVKTPKVRGVAEVEKNYNATPPLGKSIMDAGTPSLHQIARHQAAADSADTMDRRAGKVKKILNKYSPSDSVHKYLDKTTAGDMLSVQLERQGDTAGARKAREGADLNMHKAAVFDADAKKEKK